MQQPSLEGSQAKTWLEGSEDGASPQISLCQPPKLCTVLSTSRCASVAPDCVPGSAGPPCSHHQVSKAARAAHSPPEVGDKSPVATSQLAGNGLPSTSPAPRLSQKQMPRVCRRPGGTSARRGSCRGQNTPAANNGPAKPRLPAGVRPQRRLPSPAGSSPQRCLAGPMPKAPAGAWRQQLQASRGFVSGWALGKVLRRERLLRGPARSYPCQCCLSSTTEPSPRAEPCTLTWLGEVSCPRDACQGCELPGGNLFGK